MVLRPVNPPTAFYSHSSAHIPPSPSKKRNWSLTSSPAGYASRSYEIAFSASVVSIPAARFSKYWPM